MKEILKNTVLVILTLTYVGVGYYLLCKFGGHFWVAWIVIYSLGLAALPFVISLATKKQD